MSAAVAGLARTISGNVIAYTVVPAVALLFATFAEEVLLASCSKQIQKILLSSKVGQEFGNAFSKNLVLRDQLSNIIQINIFQEDGRLKWKQKKKAHKEMCPRGNGMF